MSVEKANRTWHAGKPKKKPDYDREEITEELLAAVVGVYEALDEYGNHPSLQAIVDELDCGLNPLKVRKLLITAGKCKVKRYMNQPQWMKCFHCGKRGRVWRRLCPHWNVLGLP